MPLDEVLKNAYDALIWITILNYHVHIFYRRKLFEWNKIYEILILSPKSNILRTYLAIDGAIVMGEADTRHITDITVQKSVYGKRSQLAGV